MKPLIYAALIVLQTFNVSASNFQKDIFNTSEGDLSMTFIGHGTLMMEFNGKVIHIDPVSRYADYSKLPKADLILITHEHGDHLDTKAIELIKKGNTQIVLTEICNQKYTGTAVLKNNESGTFANVKVKAVAAYNIKNERSPGKPYHPKGRGNGYVLNFGDTRVYVAGDTENIPEMAELKDIDIAFLPMNLPYTMSPKMVANAVEIIQPEILYPYHFGNTDTNELKKIMDYKNIKNTKVRIRELK
jgi:L-ascorbate metabolism protein UlaG (beta-lactamase superfamily)